MPIYEFECDDCHHRFEKMMGADEVHTCQCPLCNGKDVHRVYSFSGVVYKGSGFYCKDHGSSCACESCSHDHTK